MSFAARIKRGLARRLPLLTFLSYEVRSRRHAGLSRARRDEEAVVSTLSRGLGKGLAPGPRTGRTVLLISMGQANFAPLERVVCAAFEANGLRPIVVGPRHWPLRKAFRLLGQRDFTSFPDFLEEPPPAAELAPVVEACATALDLLNYRRDGVPVGTFAVSTTMRALRDGTLDMAQPQVRPMLLANLVEAVAAHDATRRMLDRYDPAAVVMIDRGYTPNGQIAQNCMARGIPVFTLNSGHRNNVALLKRYRLEIEQEHPHSLSGPTWQKLVDGPWTAAMERRLHQEVDGAYHNQEWYAEVGTQRNTRMVDKSELITKLGLDPAKKVAAIFPHIFWDATFFWGTDLFPTYEEWFRAAVKAAASDDRLNWLIKVHPANRVKSIRDGHSGMHSEEEVAREVLGGDLPAHIRLIPADSEISTLSVFDILDYCLTVRGTVGIECAARGITVLTCGTGRYDRHGFTVDFQDTESYLATLARLDQLPPPSPEQVILAKKFAYGTFVLRPTPVDSIRHVYGGDDLATLSTEMVVRSRAELMAAPDVAGLAAFIASGDDDYCNWELHARLSAPDTRSEH